MLDLDDYSDESLEMRKTVQELLQYIIDNRCSLRQVADNFPDYSVSMISRYISTYGKMYFYDEWTLVNAILKNNKENLFKPRDQWRRRDKKSW